jgi:hypothetical protein
MEMRNNCVGHVVGTALAALLRQCLLHEIVRNGTVHQERSRFEAPARFGGRIRRFGDPERIPIAD